MNVKTLKKFLTTEKWTVYSKPDESILLSDKGTMMIRLPSIDAIELKGRTVSVVMESEQVNKKFELWDRIIRMNEGKAPIQFTGLAYCIEAQENTDLVIMRDIQKGDIFPINRNLYSVFLQAVYPGHYRSETGLIMGENHVGQVCAVIAANMSEGWQDSIKEAYEAQAVKEVQI